MRRKYGCVYGLFFKERLASFLGRLAGERCGSRAFGIGRRSCGVGVAFCRGSRHGFGDEVDRFGAWIFEIPKGKGFRFPVMPCGDPDMRWDLLYLPDYENDGVLVPGGKLRIGKAEFYRKQMISRNILT